MATANIYTVVHKDSKMKKEEFNKLLENIKMRFECAITHILNNTCCGCRNVQKGIVDIIYNCYDVFINVMQEQDDDFLIVKQLFFNVLEEICKEAFKKQKNEVLSTCFVVNILSLKEFKELFNPKNIKQNTCIFKITCFFLKKENRVFINSMTEKNLTSLHISKLNIITSVLNNFVDYIDEETDKSYLISCAQLLGEYELANKIKSYKTNPLEIDLRGMRKAFNVTVVEVAVADGHIYDRPRDPPGQRSVYIPPGDPTLEAYRLSTYMKYPNNSPVKPRQLASLGFLYTGYKDRVKCFCCGLCVENWTVGDDPNLPRWHRKDCEFMKGEDCGNKPIMSLLSRMKRTGGRNRDGGSASGSSGEMETQQANNVSTGTATAVPNIRPNVPAGSLFQQPGTNIPMQTARPVTPSQQIRQYQRIDFATMPSAHHEHLVLSLDLRKESDRLRTFETWPSHPRTVFPGHLAQYGFFYLGNLDRVQCFSCGGVLRNWNFGDNVEIEHRRHFPHCSLVHEGDRNNIPLSTEERATYLQQQTQEPPDPTDAELRDLREMFPCLFPVSPHMRNEESRLETFDDRWPSNQVHATPQQIAKAGFFFLGDRDRVKCWYCNGGLQNWDPDDEPWTEHAKWFPNCEFLLQRKGHDYVSRMVALYPNLPRPVLRGADETSNTRQSVQISFGSNNTRNSSPPPPIIDPKAVRIEELKKLKNAMKSDIVKSAIEMGFDSKLIRKIVKRRLQNADMFSSVSELVDIITSHSGNLSDSEDSLDGEEGNTESKMVVGSSSAQVQVREGNFSGEHSGGSGEPMDQEITSFTGTSPSMEARIRELQEERRCKICIDRIADVVFVPCGHLCCCVECAEALSKCPMCRRKIEKAIRTYMS